MDASVPESTKQRTRMEPAAVILQQGEPLDYIDGLTQRHETQRPSNTLNSATRRCRRLGPTWSMSSVTASSRTACFKRSPHLPSWPLLCRGIQTEIVLLPRQWHMIRAPRERKLVHWRAQPQRTKVNWQEPEVGADGPDSDILAPLFSQLCFMQTSFDQSLAGGDRFSAISRRLIPTIVGQEVNP